MHLQTREGVVVVPTPAIQRGPNGVFVYVVGPDSTVAVRNRQVDTMQGPLTIVAQGIQPGERVVVDGQNQLRAGAKVDPRPVPMPAPPGAQQQPQAAPRSQAEGGTPDAQGQRSPAPAQGAQSGQPRPDETPQQRQAHPSQQGAPREASVQ